MRVLRRQTEEPIYPFRHQEQVNLYNVEVLIGKGSEDLFWNSDVILKNKLKESSETKT